MPCDIGYKSYEKVALPEPQPEMFAEKSETPTLDADLLEKLGIEDPDFLAWVTELGVKPLLEEALERSLEDIDTNGLDFTISPDNMLVAKGKFFSAQEKKRLSEASSTVSRRWQFEVLGIVAELLDYSVTITQKGKVVALEAEEVGKSHPCDYIKVTSDGNNSELTFEHFKSRKMLDTATAKFKILAEKLGVKIVGEGPEIKEGDPFPTEVHHSHRHDHGHKHEKG